ncbi:MAG: cytochrome c [Rhodanobacteraceae bacterium]
MKFIFKLIVLLVLILIATGAWVWSGQYNIGADSPHWKLTRQAIGILRERSIETRAGNIRVPDLDDPALLSEGAEHYSEMCTGCHLAPGMDESEMREGLYPKPPNLTRFAPAPAEAFWAIKHGIKMSGMPAWGKTHNDQKIWAMVAYLQEQPTLTPARYRQLAGQKEEQAMPGHGNDPDQHDHAMDAEAGDAVGEPAMAASVPVAPQSSQ